MSKNFLLAFLFLLLLTSLRSQENLFKLIPASTSGIYFENTIQDTRDHSILKYSNFYGGAGVAIADLDNDGLQDIYFAGNQVADKIYKNLGNLHFQDMSTEAGIVSDGSWSSSVIMGDVNNDGLIDIYVTCELYDDETELRKNKLYINQGDFHFKESAKELNIDDSERTRGATFIDYNKDGYLDLFLLNQPPNPGNYSKYSGQNLLQEQWSPRLYENVNGKKFVDVSAEAGVIRPGYGNAVVAADLTNDGWTDLYVSNDYDAPDFMYINNGNGTFTEKMKESMPQISYYSMGVDIADINNDCLPEVMTLDMVAEDNYRLKANMGGMYPEQFWNLVSRGGHYQYMFNALHLNYGNLHFGNIGQLAGVSNTDWSWSNLIADFDNDGWKDIHVTNGLLRDIRNSDVAKKFPKYIQHLAEDYMKENPDAKSVPIMDILDLEKALDMHPSVPLSNYAFRNNGDLTFTKVQESWGLDEESFSNGSAYADLDNDGDLDLVINNINSPAFLYENQNSDQNYLRITLSDPASNQTVLGTKAIVSSPSGKQYQELITTKGMYSCSEPILHFGLGSTQMIDTLTIIWPNDVEEKFYRIKANQVLHLEMPNNGKKQENGQAAGSIVKNGSEFGLDFVHHENNFDDYSRQILLPHKLSQLGPALAIADVNNDGLDDVYVGGAEGYASALYIQKNNERFERQQTWTQDSMYEDIDAAFFDIEGDGDLDLYVVSGGNAHPARNKIYLDRFYLNDGKGNFTRSEDKVSRVLESGSCVRPADYDGDGDIDLFIGGRHSPWDYPQPTISRLLRNDSGTLTDVTKELGSDFIFNGMVTDAVWHDYNGDGQTDLIVVGEWMPITFYKNQNGKLSKDNSIEIAYQNEEFKTDGWWQTISLIDADRDGKKDILCGNLGTNYKYKASQKEPFEVFYDDFDDNGQKDIVLSYYNFGERYPLRGRSCSSQQIPNLQEEFPTYDLFAQATTEEVYDPTHLEKALHLQAYTFSSMILYQNESSKFEVQLLPNEAQVSQLNSSIWLANGNELEIIAAGNMSQAEIETPKSDASVGSYLSINPDRKIKVVAPNQSGLYLEGDIRQLKKLKIGNKNYVLAASNNGPLQIFSEESLRKSKTSGL